MNPVFVAIDTPDLERAVELAEAVRSHAGGVKLGLEFFSAQGPEGVRRVAALGLPVFLDVKLHDIPNTVGKAVEALGPLEPAILTVHAAGGEAMLAACEAAGVDAFAPNLPDGYDTLIGERGGNLSGGQRQRVALARALVTGARIVVLDDPLSAVDTLTERRLVARLRPALSGRTVLVATQRLSTVEIADRAVVLRDGRIVESGTPAELLRAGGEFATLFGDEVIAA